MPEDISSSLPFRETYDSGLKKLVDNRRAELDRIRAGRMSPEKIAADRETYRAEYLDLLGWPLNAYDEYRKTPMNVRKIPHGENDFAVIWQMQFEVLPELWFYGLFFEHKNKSEDLPFVICQHGGLGTPEVVSGVLGETYNYNNLLERAATYGKGANTFAPGLYLWHDDYGPKKDRNSIDNALKQLGGSIAALEVYAIRRTLDYFMDEGIAKEKRIGMIGLSYGGSYTLLTAAADTRITAAYSSCQYNDRYLHNWADWTWKGSGMFLDAEMAALVAPRALYLEEGDNDELFDDKTFLKECERAVPFYRAAGAEGKLKYRVFEGTHELCRDNDGYDFVFRYIQPEMVLAYDIYPEPYGTVYTERELKNPQKVIEMFGVCGILDAIITKSGWDYLIATYGYEKLYELDKESGWWDCDTIEEYITWIEYERRISQELTT